MLAHMDIERNQIRPTSPVIPAATVPCAVDHDAVDPGPQCRPPLEMSDGPKDAEEDLLAQIERFVRVAQKLAPQGSVSET